MKKVLIDAHATKADALLAKIKTHYLSKVHLLIYRIQSLGITGINKDMVAEAISRNLQPLREKYREIYEKDVNLFATSEMRAQVENGFVLKFKEIEAAVEDFYTTEIPKRLPFSLDVLAGVFELDKNQKPYISDVREVAIREGFKEFIEDPDMLQAYYLHAETAKKLQELIKLIQKTGISTPIYNRDSIIRLFEVEENAESGAITVSPIQLDYKGTRKATQDAIDEGLDMVEKVVPRSRAAEIPWEQ